MTHPNWPSTHPPPYGVQVELMSRIGETLDRGNVGIFESPTGTGKTMSLICSVVPWILKNAAIEEEDERERGEGRREASDATPAWVVSHRTELESRDSARLKELRTRRRELLETHRNSRTNSIMSPSAIATTKKTAVLGKRHRDANHKDDDDDEEEEEEDQVETERIFQEQVKLVSDRRKLFYCSRTHSQLSQFLRELRGVYGPEEIAAVTLGARTQLCVNEGLIKACGGSTKALNDRCIDLMDTAAGCPHLGDILDTRAIRDAALDAIHDIEELKREGRGGCPYYAARQAVRAARVVAVPYTTLLNSSTRDSMELDVRGHVVVCDEAHNLLDAVADAHAASVSLHELRGAQAELKTYLEKYRERFNLDNAATLAKLGAVIALLSRYLGGETTSSLGTPSATSTTTTSSFVIPLDDFLAQSKLVDVNLFELLKKAGEAQLTRKLRGVARELRSLEAVAGSSPRHPPPPVSSPRTPSVVIPSRSGSFSPSPHLLTNTSSSSTGTSIQGVLNFLGAVTAPAEDARVHVTPRTSLRFVLMNPGSRFSELVKRAHSVILLGGTMHPVEDVVAGLFPNLPRERLDLFSCGHVIPPSNLTLLAVPRGPSLRELRTSFATREDASAMDEIGAALRGLVSLVPEGLVVFFPSYKTLRGMCERWEITGLMKEIESKKPLVRERGGNLTPTPISGVVPHVSPSLDPHQITTTVANNEKQGGEEDAWSAYVRLMRADPVRGAVLFAVMGGKLSEGINFSDGLARCVGVVGLPFADRNDPVMAAKMAYLTSKSEGAGERYYENQCWRTVNQSIGRAIRHAKDYAAIVLLDARFGETSARDRLPRWMGGRYVKTEGWSEVVRLLTNFYREKRGGLSSSASFSSPVGGEIASTPSVSASLSATAMLSNVSPPIRTFKKWKKGGE